MRRSKIASMTHRKKDFFDVKSSRNKASEIGGNDLGQQSSNKWIHFIVTLEPQVKAIMTVLALLPLLPPSLRQRQCRSLQLPNANLGQGFSQNYCRSSSSSLFEIRISYLRQATKSGNRFAAAL